VNGTNVIQMFDFVDINGGTIDGATVGAASASTGAFTSLTASGATTLNGAVALGDASGDLITVPGTVNSNLLFTDATYDIGASGATRPRDLFLSRNLTVGGTLTLAGGVNLNGNVTVGDSSADTLTINSTITSNLIFTDNTYDIGASGATRPRSLFLAGNITAAGNQTLTGALTVDSTTDSTSTTTGSIQTDGGLGVAKALFVGTSIRAGTSISAQGTFAGFTGAGAFISYESTFGRFEAYDYGTSAYKDLHIAQNGGNVAIGAAANTLKLNVYQATVGVGVFRAAHVNGNQIEIAPSYNYYDAYNHIFRSLSATTEYARFLNTGFFGIGTNNPQTILQINSTAPTIRIEETTTGGSKRLELGVTSGGQAFIGANQSAQTLVLQTVGTTRLTIGATGNLDVAGSGNFNVEGGYVRAGGGSDAGTQLVMWTTSGGDGNIAAFQTIFATGSNSARTERMRISNTGRITINNTEYTCINGSVNGKTPAGTGFSLGYNPSGGSGESQLVWGTGGSTYPFIISSYDGATTSERSRFTSTGNFLLGTTSSTTTATGGFTLGDSKFHIFSISSANSNSTAFSAQKAALWIENDASSTNSEYAKPGLLISSYEGASSNPGPLARFYRQVSPSAPARVFEVNYLGNIGLGDTNASTTGTGITFPATQSASSNANTLDDYEEGFFTATVTTSTSGTITLNGSIDKLAYTKIGRVVYVQGLLEILSVSSPVGAVVYIQGLPFTTADLDEYAGRAGTAFMVKTIVTAVNIFEGQTQAEVNIDASTLVAGNQFYVSFNYIAA
jgi:hypothetical protein